MTYLPPILSSPIAKLLAPLAAAMLLPAPQAGAALLVYDTDSNLYWIGDGNLFKTQAAANPSLVSQIIAANGGVVHDTPNVWDNFTGTYTLGAQDFSSGGQLSWWGAQAWVGYLNHIRYDGYHDWRLPVTTGVFSDHGGADSELGHLFYTELGNTVRTDPLMALDSGPFRNFQDDAYWTGTQVASDPGFAWMFSTQFGFQGNATMDVQYFAMVVRPGDAAPVPVPAAVWLFASALAGLGAAGRGRKAASRVFDDSGRLAVSEGEGTP